MMKDHQKGHRERLRQKYVAAGPKALHDYEMVELLLTYAIPQRDVKPIAKELLARFGNFAGIVDAPLEELAEIKGLGTTSAILLKVVKEVSLEYLADKMKEKNSLSSPQAVRNFARMKLAGYLDEAFMVIYLNTKNHVNDYEIIQEGTIDQAIIYPRTLVKKALAKNASGVIIVHNHPSGICEPSGDDKRLTDAIKNAVLTVNIRLIDHIIVGKAGYFSFVENKIL